MMVHKAAAVRPTGGRRASVKLIVSYDRVPCCSSSRIDYSELVLGVAAAEQALRETRGTCVSAELDR